jgi:hypothetical protein
MLFFQKCFALCICFLCYITNNFYSFLFCKHVFFCCVFFSVVRLGGIDAAAAVQEEFERYEVPKFMCTEGAKLRYLADCHVTRALQEALFHVINSPKSQSPFPLLNARISKFPTYFSVFNGVEDETIQEFMLHPARLDRLKPVKKAQTGSALHVIKLDNLPANLQNFVSGGIFGPDRVLTALGAHAEKVFLNMWHIAPLFATPPASRPGMQIKVFCGVALSTALQWCAPKTHRLQRIQQRRRERHRLLYQRYGGGDTGTGIGGGGVLQPDTDEVEDHNIIDHVLLEPTAAQKTERKGLFSRLLGGSKPQPTANELRVQALQKKLLPSHAIHSERGSDVAMLEEASSIHYFDSDYEDTDFGERTERNLEGDEVPPFDVDSGNLKTAADTELEVVIQVHYDTPAMLSQVFTGCCCCCCCCCCCFYCFSCRLGLCFYDMLYCL